MNISFQRTSPPPPQPFPAARGAPRRHLRGLGLVAAALAGLAVGARAVAVAVRLLRPGTGGVDRPRMKRLKGVPGKYHGYVMGISWFLQWEYQFYE